MIFKYILQDWLASAEFNFLKKDPFSPVQFITREQVGPFLFSNFKILKFPSTLIGGTSPPS